MPKATVRANARTLPEPTPKPDDGAATLEEPSLLNVSNELTLVCDLVKVGHMAADSLPHDIGGEALSHLLSTTSERLQDAIDDLENIREAAMTRATNRRAVLANHKAVYDERERLEKTGHEDAYNELVSKADRLLLKLAKAPCANDEEFFAKLEHIAEIEIKDAGDPEGQNFESTMVAVRSYLAQRSRVH